MNKSVDDVISVAQNIGTERASDPETLKVIEMWKFSEALKRLEIRFHRIVRSMSEFDEILNIIGTDLNGYT